MGNSTKLLFGELQPASDEFDRMKEGMTVEFIENLQEIGRYKWNTLVRSLGQQKHVARGNEEGRNAFYYLNLNTVRMKTGMIVNGLLGLGFSPSFPTAFLYGGFFVLAHEIAHGFDTRGARYNKDGVLGEEWWKNDEKEEFYRKADCLVNQYRQFNITHKGKDFSADSGGNYCIDSGERARCAAEDIADNIGLRLAYNALQHFRGKDKESCLPDLPFSANQLFWVTYAMDWCTLEDKSTYQELLESAVSRGGHKPSPWRVNLPLSNLVEFANDFNCPARAKLRPPVEETCSLV